MSGLKYEPGTLEESLARRAFDRKNEIEFLKVLAVCNTITTVGNGIIAAVSKSDAPGGGDSVKKTIDALQALLVPQWAEDTERKAKKAREVLVREVSKGIVRIKILGKDKSRKKRR